MLNRSSLLEVLTRFAAVAIALLVLAQTACAAWTPSVMPLLAQDATAEGGLPIIEWAIVVVLIGVTLFVICRSSRRN
jgi:hypothetical protein